MGGGVVVGTGWGGLTRQPLRNSRGDAVVVRGGFWWVMGGSI